LNPFVILNPGAGAGDPAALADALAMLPGAVVGTTEGEGEAARLARQAAAKGFDLIIAAGGDGTVSQVVDGLASVVGPPRLGILPLGTGNDLCRTLGIPLDVRVAAQVILNEVERPLDLIELIADDGAETHAINVAAGGFSGEVDEAMAPGSKQRWGPLAYVWGAFKVLPEVHPFRARLSFDGGEPVTAEVLNIVVANGRSVAGGKLVAPRANPEDGLLDVVLVRYGNVLDLARVGARILGGDYLEADLVEHRLVTSLRVESDPPMLWNADGELFTRAAVTFRVRPRALRVLVGPEYRPQGDPS
jgi:diacylglycerol kinase (ATP)